MQRGARRRGLAALLLVLLAAGTAGAVEPVRGAELPEPVPGPPLLYLLDGPQRIYLFGTIHTNDVRVAALPPVVLEALDQCDVFWGEIDLATATFENLADGALLPDGTTLADHVDPALLERIRTHAARLDLDHGALMQMAPWALHLLLAQSVGGRGEGEGEPMDWRLFERARERGLVLGGLERPVEQVDVFRSLPAADQVRLVEVVLDEAEAVEAGTRLSTFEALVRAYVAGDAEAVREACVAAFGPDPRLMAQMERVLLSVRDERLVVRMLARASRIPQKAIFVAVGAAHLGGDDGLLRRLARAGRTPRRLGIGAHPAGASPLALPAPIVRPCPPRRPRPCLPLPCPPLPLPLPR